MAGAVRLIFNYDGNEITLESRQRVDMLVPPGEPIDTMARLVAQSMSSNLGQQVIVENRPGAGSTIGSKAVASAEPDGYTLLFGSSGSLGVAPALYTDLGLDPLKSFAPIASVSLLPPVMVVPATVPRSRSVVCPPPSV